MGGILSSSPELQETAMTFANGGGADLPDYIINVPGLTAEGEYLRISSATLEKLNNAVPEVMANARMVSPVEMVISEGFSSLVANARPGDAVVGTRVNRLREQRATDRAAAPDLAPVSIPPDTAEISFPTASTQDNLASINGVDTETVRRIRDSDAKRSEAALIESLAPNNAQGQPGGTLGARYAESDDDLRMINSQRYIESLIKGDPFSGELSPSQTARNQETLSNTLRREEIAQQRADIAESGRIAQDAADTRKAFSVPLEEPPMFEASKGKFFKDGTTSLSALESGIAKAVPTEPMFEASEGKFFKDGKGSLTEQAAGAVSNAVSKLFSGTNKTGAGEQTETFVRESKPNPFAVTSSPVVTPSEELISVTPKVTEEVIPKVTETVEDNTGFVSVTLNPGTISMSVFDFNPTTGELRPRGGNADLMLSGSPRAEANVQKMVLDQYTLDTKIKPVVKAQSEAKQAQAVFEAEETGDTLTSAGDAARKLREAEAVAETVDTPSAVEQVLSRKTPFKDVPYGLDVVEEEQLIRREKEGVSESVGDADQQLAEEQVSAAQEAPEPAKPTETTDATMDLLKQLDEDTRSRLGTEEESGVTAPPKVAPAVVEKINLGGAEAGLGQGFGGDGSIGDLTKDYVKLLKSLLGESDEDKAARKGELFMLMGAALMSGKSSNALTNIGGALQIGAKAAIQDRATRKKREDTIGLKGFELAADRIAKREATEATIAAEGRAFKRDKLLLVERLKNAKNLAEFNSELGNTYIKSGPYKSLLSEYKQARKTFDDSASNISNEDRELGFANYFTKLMLESKYDPLDIQTFNLYQGRSSLPTTGGGGGQTLDDIK